MLFFVSSTIYTEKLPVVGFLYGKRKGGNMNIALLLSGGTGTRLGADIPKQYYKVGNRPMITYAMERLFHHKNIDAVHIVAGHAWQGQIREWLLSYDSENKFRGFSVPGENRQLSIFHGLEDIKKYAEESDFVLIHDAARPLVSDKQITDCLDAANGHDGVLPVLPMKDTVYASKDGKTIFSLLKREEVFAGQAPELFCFGKYYEATRNLLPDQILQVNGATEPAVMAGMDIAMIPGDENNFKITTRADLERLRKIIRA